MSCNEPGPRPEAVAAAGWWASKLGRGSARIGGRTPGELDSEAFALTVQALAGRAFTGEQRDAFRRELEHAIEAHLQQDGDNWRPEQPQWAAAIRAIACDHGPHPVLETAAARAGIDLKTLDLPIKTVMWINPGTVKVAEGYRAEPVTVWEFRDVPDQGAAENAL